MALSLPHKVNATSQEWGSVWKSLPSKMLWAHRKPRRWTGSISVMAERGWRDEWPPFSFLGWDPSSVENIPSVSATERGVVRNVYTFMWHMTSSLSNTLIDSNIFLHPFPFTMQVVPSLPLTNPKDHLTHTLFGENKSKPSFSWPPSPHLWSQLLLLSS